MSTQSWREIRNPLRELNMFPQTSFKQSLFTHATLCRGCAGIFETLLKYRYEVKRTSYSRFCTFLSLISTPVVLWKSCYNCCAVSIGFLLAWIKIFRSCWCEYTQQQVFSMFCLFLYANKLKWRYSETYLTIRLCPIVDPRWYISRSPLMYVLNQYLLLEGSSTTFIQELMFST